MGVRGGGKQVGTNRHLESTMKIDYSLQGGINSRKTCIHPAEKMKKTHQKDRILRTRGQRRKVFKVILFITTEETKGNLFSFLQRSSNEKKGAQIAGGKKSGCKKKPDEKGIPAAAN